MSGGVIRSQTTIVFPWGDMMDSTLQWVAWE